MNNNIKTNLPSFFTLLVFNLAILYYYLENPNSTKMVILSYYIQSVLMSIFGWLITYRYEVKVAKYNSTEIETKFDLYVERVRLFFMTFFHFTYFHIGFGLLVLLFLSFMDGKYDFLTLYLMIGGLVFHYLLKGIMHSKKDITIEKVSYIVAVPYIRIIPLFAVMGVLYTGSFDIFIVMMTFMITKTIVDAAIMLKGNTMSDIT